MVILVALFSYAIPARVHAARLIPVDVVNVGIPAYGIALTADGVTALVSRPVDSPGPSEVILIDVPSATLRTTLPLHGSPASGLAIAVAPNGATALVYGDGALDVIDIAGETVTENPTPTALVSTLAILPDARTVLVGRSGSGINALAVLKTPTANDWQNLVGVLEAPLSASAPRTIIVVPGADGTIALVVNEYGTVDVFQAPSIDAWESAVLVRTINVGGQLSDAAITPDGKTTLVTNIGSHRVEVLEAPSATNWSAAAVVHSITGIPSADGIAIDPSGTRAVVTHTAFVSGASLLEAPNMIGWALVTAATDSLPLSGTPFKVVITPDNTRALVARYHEGLVSVLVICGNGVVAVGEQCDDGNTANGDCCSSVCQYESNSSPCGDGNACTVDTCDGAGSCLSQMPTGCKTAEHSLLFLENDAIDDAKDKLTWKWLKGEQGDDLGYPPSTTSYTLCLRAGTSSAAVALPAGSKWEAVRGHFKYQDASGTPDGAQKAVLNNRGGGNAKALVKGKGTRLPDTLAPMLALPVTVQLVNDTNSTCFEAVYGSGDVIKNDTKQFKAKAH